MHIFGFVSRALADGSDFTVENKDVARFASGKLARFALQLCLRSHQRDEEQRAAKSIIQSALGAEWAANLSHHGRVVTGGKGSPKGWSGKSANAPPLNNRTVEAR